jgi:hypothetical protein
MASSTFTNVDTRPAGVDPPPTGADKPELTASPSSAPPDSEGQEPVDTKYWERCLSDAERAERDWRKRGREITAIYRNEHGSGGSGKSRKGSNKVTFNILFANTETMLPAIYTQPPEPVVRSRFTAPDKPPQSPLPPPMAGPVGPPMPSTGLPPEIAPVDQGLGPQPETPGQPGIPGANPPEPVPGMSPPGGLPMVPNGAAAAGGPPLPPAAAAMAGAPLAPGAGKPSQKAIEAAASVMEKALEIVVDDEQGHESVKAALKDVLLPGRGACRVRWKPEMAPDPNGGGEIKVWETVGDEYVYWEDLLIDPVRAPGDTDWIAFRHLFGEQALLGEFGETPDFKQWLKTHQIGELLKWTEESAGKEAVGGGGALRTTDKLGDVIKKCMAWEIWDRVNRRIIWFVRDAGGLVLRVDEDTYKLTGFYPIPRPILAVTTTDTQIPRPFYDLYADLAADLDETSRRISNLTKQVKVRGGYNAASRAMAELLTADDQKMIPVEGVDMLNGGLQNHIWLVPIVEFMNALKELYLARDQIKQAIYEIMGISDIMRGATKASETATAQRIKGSMGMVRLADQKQQAGNFVRDLLRMKAELIAQNFDPETLAKMTGEDVTPEVMDILRSDFQRTCSIDIESDSTVVPDQQEEQQSMAMVMQSVQAVMTGAASMLQTGLLPPPQVTMLALELLKMFLHPIRFSRGVVELIDDFIEQLQGQIAMQSMMPPPPPPGAGLPAPGGPPPGNGAGPSPPPPPGGAPPSGRGLPPMPPGTMQ